MDKEDSVVRNKTEQGTEDNGSDAYEDFLRSIEATGDDDSASQEEEERESSEKNLKIPTKLNHEESTAIKADEEALSQTIKCLPSDQANSVTSAGNNIKPENETQITRNIYTVHPNVDSTPIKDVVMIKKRLGIETTGIDVPKPITSFNQLSLSLPPGIMKRMEKLGYLEPTAVQCQTIPILLQGRNTLIMGGKGSGKTVAYLVSLICQIFNVLKEKKTLAKKRRAYCLIIGPTLDGGNAIFNLLRQLLKKLSIRVALIVSCYSNYNQVISGTEFLIATPTKLNDLLKQNFLSLSDTGFVVFDDFPKLWQKYPDEVSMLLSKENMMKVIVSRESLGSDTLRGLRRWLKHSITVRHLINESISEFNFKWLLCMKEECRIQKTRILGDLISHFHQNFRMIIFANEKVTVTAILEFLCSLGKTAASLHNSWSPQDLEVIMDKFNAGTVQILVSRDTPPVNITIPSVNYIVNFDMPKTFEAFCARIHTPIQTEVPVVYNFLGKQDSFIASHLCYWMTKESMPVPPILEPLACNHKEYRDFRRYGKPLASFTRELNLDVRTLDEKASQQHHPAYVSPQDKPNGNLGLKSDQTPGSIYQQDYIMDEKRLDSLNLKHALDSPEQAQGGGGREYGVDDELSSDDGFEVVPKRQITKSEGLIDIGKVKQRRLKLLKGLSDDHD